MARGTRMRQRLTDAAVRDLKPAATEYAVYDAVVDGLAIRVQRSGAKSWVWRRRTDASRATLGRFPAMPVETARAAALQRVLDADAPKPATTALRRRSPLFADFAAAYVERHAGKWKPSTVVTVRKHLRRQLLPALGAQRLDAISHADVARWYYAYGRTSPGGANRAHDILDALFETALKWGALPKGAENPAKGLPAFKRPPVGRMLTAEELERLGAVLTSPTYRDEPASAVIRLMLMTGCRPGEIVNLKWGQVERKQLQIEDSKTGRRAVQLSPEASSILAALRTRRDQHRRGRAWYGSSDYVFPSRDDPNQPTKAQIWLWPRIRDAAELAPGTRLYDLRHTFASIAVSNGESLQMTSQLLGHRRYSTTQRYAHLDAKHLVAANQRISDAIERMVAASGAK